MKILTALRRVEEDTYVATNLRAQLQRYGYETKFSRPLAGARYLRFHGQFEDLSEITGLLDLSSWTISALPSLEGIDWLSVEDQLIQPLIKEHPLHLALSHQHAPFTELSTLELVADVNPSQELPSLSATPGIVIVERFTPHSSQYASETAVFDRLPVPLTFSIGYSKLPYEALATIEVGDVLLIEHIEGRITSNGRTLFISELNQEGIMILNSAENENDPFEPSAPTENKSGLNTLPVELSVILMEKMMPLAQLKAISPGEIIELPSDSMLDVEIRTNGRCFARGELVQLANGQLGVEIRTLWPQE